MTEGQDQPKVLHFLDSWKFGVGVAFVAILALSLFSIKLYADVRGVADTNRQTVIDNSQQDVNRCFASAAQGPVLRKVLTELERIFMDPQAKEAVRNFRRANLRNTPTVRECRELAQTLRVRK